MKPFEFNSSTYQQRIDQALHNTLNGFDIPAAIIRESIHYALFPAGKRLRPLLVYLTGEITGGSPECLDTIAVAIELLHGYSLIHDDLPSMDNDDFRRGKPSCHKAFNEAVAILSGDGLQSMAIELLLKQLPLYIELPRVIDVIATLTEATGVSGVISGQSLDLTELTQPALTKQELYKIHFLKTGRFILACVQSVLKAQPIEPSIAQTLEQFAVNLGIAFQLQDDYLDEFACTNYLGKHRASDAANHKITFARLYSKQELLEQVNTYYEKSLAELSPLGKQAQSLLDFTYTLQQRSIVATQ